MVIPDRCFAILPPTLWQRLWIWWHRVDPNEFCRCYFYFAHEGSHANALCKTWGHDE